MGAGQGARGMAVVITPRLGVGLGLWVGVGVGLGVAAVAAGWGRAVAIRERKCSSRLIWEIDLSD